MNPKEKKSYDIYTHELGHNETLQHTFLIEGGDIPAGARL